MSTTRLARSQPQPQPETSRAPAADGELPEPLQKVFLSPTLYVPVDRDGYCRGQYAEGAFGVVVQAISAQNPELRQAVKFPRLLADTHRENAYICGLLEDELASLVELEGRVGANKAGLLGGQFLFSRTLRRPLQSRDTLGESQHGRVLILQFVLGKPPRFCSVQRIETPEGPETRYHPPGWAEEVESLPDDHLLRGPEAVDGIERLSRRGRYAWCKTVAIPKRSANGGAGEAFALDNTLARVHHDETYYASVPLILFNWGIGTLQELLSMPTGEGIPLAGNHDQRTRDYLDLLRRILQGLVSLHEQGFLHADLRPANIMFQALHKGRPALSSFALIDYTSLSFQSPTLGARRPSELERETEVGASLGGVRMSPFYAPERRAGLERENLDVALILHEDGENNEDGDLFSRVVLGWRRNLLEGNNRVSKRIRQTVLDYEFDDGGAPTGLEEIRPGDRIQIRDYIFEVEAIGELEGCPILRCRREHWKIVHNRIVIRVRERVNEEWLAVPRVVFFFQWSMATDLWSFGALVLNLLFVDGQARTHSPRLARLVGNARFVEMLDHLASAPFFKSIWRNLDAMCRQLEDAINDSSSAAQAASAWFSEEAFLNDISRALESGERMPRFEDAPPEGTPRLVVAPTGPRKALRDKAWELASLLIDTAPGTGNLLAAFDGNTAQFLLSLHFALCCMHRADTFKEARMFTDDPRRRPFCESRCPTASEELPAVRASRRLNALAVLFHRDALDAFVVEDGVDSDDDLLDAEDVGRGETPQVRAAVQNIQLRHLSREQARELRQLRERMASLDLEAKVAQQHLLTAEDALRDVLGESETPSMIGSRRRLQAVATLAARYFQLHGPRQSA